MADFTIEMELIQQLRDGHEELFDALWNKVKGFVYRSANRILRSNKQNLGVELTDLEQAGRVALWQTVNDYDPDQGSFFNLFVYKLKTETAIACNCRTSKQAADPLHHAESLSKPIDKNDPQGANLADLVPDPADPIGEMEEAVLNQELHNAMEQSMQRTLTEQQRNLLKKHYFKNQSYSSIANELGCSVASLYRLKNQSLNRLERQRELKAFLDEHTDYYLHIGVNTFKSTHTSAVERIVFRREDLAEYHNRKIDEVTK